MSYVHATGALVTFCFGASCAGVSGESNVFINDARCINLHIIRVNHYFRLTNYVKYNTTMWVRWTVVVSLVLRARV